MERHKTNFVLRTADLKLFVDLFGPGTRISEFPGVSMIDV